MPERRLIPEESHLRVWTYKAGLLSKVAHDLCIEAAELQAPLTVEDDGSFAVEVRARVADLRVRGQVTRGQVTPLKPKDHAEIEENIRGPKVLDAARFPEVRFAARGERLASGPLPGRLTLRGAERPLTVPLTVAEEAGRLGVTGEVRIQQTAWGITPFTALLGALKIKDEVRIDWRLTYALDA